MRKNRSIRLQIVGLICTVTAVVLSAAPLFDTASDAQILMLFFGAFGAGAIFANLLREVKDRKKEVER
jgi:hypothetical protein